jgi:hypothetical protein
MESDLVISTVPSLIFLMPSRRVDSSGTQACLLWKLELFSRFIQHSSSGASRQKQSFAVKQLLPTTTAYDDSTIGMASFH